MNDPGFKNAPEEFWQRNPELAGLLHREKPTPNPHTSGWDQVPVPIPDQVAEPAVRHGPVGEVPREESSVPGFHVRIVAYRQRLLDPDNATGGAKYVVDLIRRSGLVPNDDPASITLEVRQQRVASKEEEATEIQIIPQ